MSSFDPGQLRALRKSIGLTAAEVARRMHVSPAQVHRLEKGLRRLTVDGLIEYCHALRVSPGSLFTTHVPVPISGTIDSDFEIQPLPTGAAATTLAPPLVADMSRVAALRWEASRRFQPMRDHLVFYQQPSTAGVAEFAWNKRCLVMRDNGSQCLGWPIKDNNSVHIDVGDGPVEFNVEVRWAAPVIAVMPPFAIPNFKAEANT